MITAFQKAQLISFITGEDLNKIRLYPDSITVDENLLQEYIARVEAGETIGRIMGKRAFWRDEFFIDNTLEPRSDTETLIEAVLENFPEKERSLKFLDLGTGSGCIILSLLKEYKNATATAMDKSPDTLATARKNGDFLGLADRCYFVQGDFCEGLPDADFDIIVSNPPYIITADIATLDNTVKDFDPYISLDGGKDGLDAYRAILSHAKSQYIFFEIGQGQEIDIENIALQYGYKLVSSYKDLGNIVRVLFFEKD